MTFRTRILLAAFAALGWAEAANAQPIAPPRRPTFSTYNNIYSQASTGYGYGGYGGLYGGYGGGIGGFGFGGGFGQNALMQQQNLMLSQQLNSFNQNINNLQQFLATGVNPNFPTTGHAATFNNLGHWYSGGSGMGGSVMGGGFTTGRTAGIGMPLAGANNTGNAGGAAAGANQPRTAGTGIPIGGPRR
ncbi:MAG: hypothetical protein U0791_18615 [Gemmataceae bacterium]